MLSMTLWWYSYEPCEKFMRTEQAMSAPDTKKSQPIMHTNVYARANELAQGLHTVDLRT